MDETATTFHIQIKKYGSDRKKKNLDIIKLRILIYLLVI